ncbi:hypothetical protein GCM10027055_08850 [Janibacter alkaliphilus]|uniref:J domain-containing protein n=1 Tax=Janibacter alkaliphilus TaxID=1069963 RepID=A0A852X0M6_9MICO|nr:hypothetical protein [Janibacter alkaliphilus]NYG36047.1 hypothetical protein [Janibacter alkaliphilus]
MPELTEAQRRERRWAIARRHHPDLGGDPETYLAAMAALDGPTSPTSVSASVSTPAPAVSVVVTRRRAALRAVRRRARRAGIRTREALPRSVPGARRYATIRNDQL